MFSFNLISVLRTKRTNFKLTNDCLWLSFLIKLYLITLITKVSSESKPIRNMETIEFNSEPVFKVVVNKLNDDIIVGGRNAIYRLSSDDLQKSEEFRIGPVNDSKECLPPPFECEANKKLVNNDNQILLIYYKDKSWPVLLACGDAYQGMCWFLKASNLSFHRSYGSPNDTLNLLGSKVSSFAFVAPSSSRNDVYIAHSYDGRPIQFSPPAISSRRFYGLSGFQLSHSSGTSYTKVDIHPKYKQTYNVKYVYGFNYSHYSYFVSNQPMNLRDGVEYETRLIRICQNDNEFFSYTEIPLTCSEDVNSYVDHTISSTAYFGKIGNRKFRELNIKNEFDSYTLFISMGVPVKGWGDKLNASLGSAICAFNIKQINNAFTEAAKECFRAESHVHILETINGNPRPCLRLNAEVGDDFCGTGQNPYIGSSKPLKGLFLTLINGYVSSLAVAIQNGRTVAAIGTEDGLISKVVIDEHSAAKKPLFEMNISGQSTDRSIRPNPAFDTKEKYLYLLSGNQLVKFPFGSCSLHTDCASCLNPDPGDPLRCGWCDTYCATDEECQYPTLMSKNRCPPEVFDFTPKSGPLSGGTIVTISGDNLGTPHHSQDNSRIYITIADIECVVISQQSRRVQCRTKEVNKEVSGKIRVNVQDVTGGSTSGSYDINGTAESSEEFKFFEPQLLGVNPSFGPISGGTNVSIIGKNLHIGSNRTIYLAGIECKETDNNSTFLSCTSGQFNSSTNYSDDTSVKLFIDWSELIINQNKTIKLNEVSDSLAIKEEFQSLEWSESYEYKPNPHISSYSPGTTIKSGNTNITVFGKNLNSVFSPRMRITAFSQITKQYIHTESVCRVSPNGTQMTCPTPAIRDPIPPPKIKVPIDTQITFILDGVKDYGLNPQKSRLIYFPDPTYSTFVDGIRHVYIEEPDLKIDGKDLTSDYPIDIRISDSLGIPCILNQSNTFDAIYCRIQYNDMIFKDDDQKHAVKIKVGKISLSPGSVKFVHKPSPGIGVGAIMVSIFVPLLVISALILVVLYYLKNQGIILKEKKPIDYSIHYRPGDPESLRPPYSAQSSTNAYEDHGVTRPLLPVRRYQVSEETINLLRAEHILIARENITLEQVLGQGQFGCVYKGLLRSPEKDIEREVALKTLQSSIIRDEMDVESFLQEGLIMKDFKHHHVLTLIGVSFEEDGSPIVVLPFMENGDLLSYIRAEENNPTVKNLLIFAIDIANGMDYLSGQKFVHRDLAARNCMLDSDLTAKVADFGLSRDIYEREYYSSDNKKCKLPVKWMAPESLEKGTYNTKTDVWSYGVLVWELLTRGVTPYPDVDNWEILNYLKQGRRMPRPSFCPELLYFILLRCWSEDPKLRPTFDALVIEIQSLITKLEKSAEKQRVELDKCNTYVNYPVPNTYYNQLQSTANEEDNTQPKASTAYETTC